MRVHVRVVEGEKERIQVFQGVVIARKGGGTRETFTVRKISGGVAVERIFPLHSPTIAKLEVVRQGRVRRAKLYYLRSLRGKAARIDERRTGPVGVGGQRDLRFRKAACSPCSPKPSGCTCSRVSRTSCDRAGSGASPASTKWGAAVSRDRWWRPR